MRPVRSLATGRFPDEGIVARSRARDPRAHCVPGGPARSRRTRREVSFREIPAPPRRHRRRDRTRYRPPLGKEPLGTADFSARTGASGLANTSSGTDARVIAAGERREPIPTSDSGSHPRRISRLLSRSVYLPASHRGSTAHRPDPSLPIPPWQSIKRSIVHHERQA